MTLSEITAEKLFNEPIRDGGKMRLVSVDYPEQRAGGIIIIKDEHLFDRVVMILREHAERKGAQ